MKYCAQGQFELGKKFKKTFDSEQERQEWVEHFGKYSALLCLFEVEEPEKSDDKKYWAKGRTSGMSMIRVDTETHQLLKESAKEHGLTIKEYVAQLALLMPSDFQGSFPSSAT